MRNTKNMQTLSYLDHVKELFESQASRITYARNSIYISPQVKTKTYKT